MSKMGRVTQLKNYRFNQHLGRIVSIEKVPYPVTQSTVTCISIAVKCLGQQFVLKPSGKDVNRLKLSFQFIHTIRGFDGDTLKGLLFYYQA